MPYIDLNKTSSAAALEGHDICIVGAGAAGILLAVRLQKKGRRVLLIESGQLVADEDRQSLNVIEQTGKKMSNPVWNRKRIVGGTTTAWGGQSLPFSPLDFARRDWVENSGWPIEYAEIAKYYDAANAFMQIDTWDYSTELLRKFGFDGSPIESPSISYHFSKWAPEPNFRKLCDGILKHNVTVMYNAHLVSIDLQSDGRAGSLSIANFSGRTHEISIGQVILATGGIETNRILLQNDHQISGGLGNQSGWLGRAFMDHPSLVGGDVIPEDAKNFQRLFGTRFHHRRRYSVRLTASPDWQRQNKLLNVSAGFLFLYHNERNDPFLGVRRLFRERRIQNLPDVVRWLPRLADSAFTVVKQGYLYKPDSSAVFVMNLEQEPLLTSYIELSTSRDRFNLRKARLHWSISENSWRTAVQFAKRVKLELEHLNLAKVQLTRELEVEPSDWTPFVSDVNHHMGGTRMSSGTSEGVVNRDLQVWGVRNLFVASCSVFPTSSQSNPTLTLLALCERLAEHITSLECPGPLSKLLD